MAFFRTGGGTDTSDANATAADILLSKTAYVDDEKITGTMPNNGDVSHTIGAGEVYNVPAGYTSGGVITAIAAGATIAVSYGSEFYNKTMTCTKGTTTYTQTTTNSGSTTFNVAESGVWTITCNGVSVNVTIVLEYSTQMKPNGATVTPTDDIQTWLKCGGVYDKNYTTIGQVLADTTTLLTLISDNNAVDYMVRSTTWASSVCANSTAMTDIGANDYCAETLLDNSTWRTAICNSTYFESVLNVKIPNMTSNTTPSGECSYQSDGSITYGNAYDSFNTLGEGAWSNNGTWLRYIYDFGYNVSACKATIQNVNNINVKYGTYKMQASADKNTWDDLTSAITPSDTSPNAVQTNVFDKSTYRYFAVYISMGSTSYLGIKNIQFYGR